MNSVYEKEVLIKKIKSHIDCNTSAKWLKNLSLDELFDVEKSFLYIDENNKKSCDNKVLINNKKQIWNFVKFYAEYNEENLVKLKQEYWKYKENSLYFYFPLYSLQKDQYFRYNFIEKYPAIYELYSHVKVLIDSMSEVPFIHISPLNFLDVMKINNLLGPFIEFQDKKFERTNNENYGKDEKKYNFVSDFVGFSKFER